eukprot:CAMPEP_0182496708 /NCGR_PEP_ID=MMETSP1321-20130603/5304_1 /TAXON_ID=91990 /ORGANISM="Bolidomonas sp., Strain RCC1657" /LENGTH=269 /DNA_ID=CAMNT_0024700375 /DNA_START=44 /DNA_END=853 /DNA_ORIENTATION=+
MGAVHGCHMKYVGLGAFFAYSTYLVTSESVALPDSLTSIFDSYSPLDFKTALTYWLVYAAALNLLIGLCFKLRIGQSFLMKNRTDGTIPLISYIIFHPFYIPTHLYTYIHTVIGKSHNVPVANEVLSDYWVGGRYGSELSVPLWSVTVDLTCEFQESCINNTVKYVSSPVWDGTPPSVDEVERCAVAIRDGWSGSSQNKSSASNSGPVMVHCAHGRGRSCMIACAGLVKSGRAGTWEEAFEVVKKGRHVCKLNKGMRVRLTEWTKKYGQ